MIGYKIIAFDFGGVIGNTVEAKRRATSFELGRNVRLAEAINGSFKRVAGGSRYNAAMKRLYGTRHFLSCFEPFEGVREVLLQLAEEGNRIRIVSHAKGLTEDLLHEWCANNALIVHEFFTGQQDKTPYYSEARVAVDDSPEHLMPLQGSDVSLILFRHQEFREGKLPPDLPFKRAHNWKHLGSMLCKELPAELVAA